jgi:YgiT-type zinc finger domain-containing protein
MMLKGDDSMKETMIDTKVTYTLKHDDKFYVIEHVPARVCQKTGEEYFAPETVEHIHALIKGRKHPDRVIETPVFDYV